MKGGVLFVLLVSLAFSQGAPCMVLAQADGGSIPTDPMIRDVPPDTANQGSVVEPPPQVVPEIKPETLPVVSSEATTTQPVPLQKPLPVVRTTSAPPPSPTVTQVAPKMPTTTAESVDIEPVSQYSLLILLALLSLVPLSYFALQMVKKEDVSTSEGESPCGDLKKLMDAKWKEMTDLRGKIESQVKGIAKEKLHDVLKGTKTGEVLTLLETTEKEYNRLKKLFEQCMLDCNVQKPMQKITPFFWFEKDAREAADFYVTVFGGNSRILSASKIDNTPSGTVEMVTVALGTQEFTLMSAGPFQKINAAISFVIKCETQEEVDHYWEALSADPASEQCGWLKDKYGVSWQVVPTQLNILMSDPDKEKAGRVTQAMLKMKKLVILDLEKAHRG